MNSLDVVGPQLAVLIAAAIVVVIDAVVPHQRRLIPYVALAGLAASALWTVSWVSRGYEDDIFGGTLALDEYAAFFYFLFFRRSFLRRSFLRHFSRQRFFHPRLFPIFQLAAGGQQQAGDQHENDKQRTVADSVMIHGFNLYS